MDDPPKNPTLLTLPPKIRLKIYDHLLRFDGVEPKITWLEPFKISFSDWCAIERGSYKPPKPKPKPWAIEIRLDVLSPLQEHPLALDKAATSPLPKGHTRKASSAKHLGEMPIAKQQQQQPPPPPPDWIPLETILPILRTNRQIYTEAREVF